MSPASGRLLWRSALLLCALLLALPVLVIITSLFSPFGPAWDHLRETVLTDYLTNTLWLVLGVGMLATFLGVSTAWLNACCDYPGRRFFDWALMLPLAMPAYIIAYTYTGLLDYPGPVQSALRESFGWGYGDYWFPPIRSLGGAIAMLALVLYPYIYLLTRIALLEQGAALAEASRSLGLGPWQTFRRVTLPLVRPAIAAGLSLVLMETLADFGTVDYFGVAAFTTGIFRTWYGLGDLNSAAQLAALLLLFIFVLFAAERASRGRMRFYPHSKRPPPRIPLRGTRAILAMVFAAIVLILGFALPAFQLSIWALQRWATTDTSAFLSLVTNTFTVAAAASLLCLLVALLLAYGRRLHPRPLETMAVRVSSMGYAVPGTVIAVGVMIPFGTFDNWFDGQMRDHFGVSTGLLLSGTLAALLFAYVVRFLSVSLQSVESGLTRVRPAYDESARALGDGPLRVLGRVHLPLLRGSLLTALLLVFVDVLKELPATLILRPFNFNTLAVRSYELASDERLADAALPALTIVAIGLLPVILLTRSQMRETADP